MKNRFDYYEILEIKSSATQSEVSEAYERSKQTYSMDNPAIYTMFSEEETRDMLKLVEEAYVILGNRQLRVIYDQRVLTTSTPEDLTYNSILKASQLLASECKHHVESPKHEVNENLENDIKNCTEWTGPFLQKVREYKNFSVEKISSITKINPYYVRAIELMDSKKLPASVFVRGYVVQLAKTLKLDEKKVADSYMKLYKQQENSQHSA